MTVHIGRNGGPPPPARSTWARARRGAMELTSEAIEQIAHRVAELLREPAEPTQTNRALVDAGELARHLGVTRAWVYQHAAELGAIRIGTGKPIDANSYSDYRWRPSCHLLPFFGSYPLSRIDRALCLRFKAEKLREAQELRSAIAGGAVIRDQRGRRRVPLSPASIRKLIDTLTSILDDAIEDELIDHNPARASECASACPSRSEPFSRWTS